jgi:hypothetical protein
MKYAVEIGSGGMMYLPSFVKIGSGVKKLMEGIHRHTDSMERFHKPALFFFQNKESKLKKYVTS